MKNNMRVYIVTEGGEGIGYGHVTRCLSLCQAFEGEGISPIFIINGDKSIKNIIGGRDCVTFNWLKEGEKLLKIIDGSDITIIDSYKASRAIYAKISELALLPVFLDDYKRIDYPEGVVLNGGIHAESLAYPRKRGKTYLLGAKYALLRKDYWKTSGKKIRKSVEKILVTFGGSDTDNFTAEVLKALDEAYPEISRTAVIGKASGTSPVAGRAAGGGTRFVFDADAAEMKKVMMEADIAVAAAGQTTYELAAVGVPTVAVCVAPNQKMNLVNWMEKGFRGCALAGRRIPKEKVLEGVEYFLPYKNRSEFYKSTRDLVSADGARNAVKELLGAYGSVKLRGVKRDDCRDLWIWRNHPRARKWSFCHDAISYPDHEKWFAKKLGDRRARIYIAEDIRGRKIGQARFEVFPSSAMISVNLNPMFYGRGFGSKVIEGATRTFLEERPQVKEITAEVNAANIASIKAFKRAGYEFSSKERKAGENADIFKYRT